MFILSCIKEYAPFVMIGGISGIGKTSLIDYLLSHYPDSFEQPLSFTSRKKRNEGERYHFVSKEAMFQLYSAGALINLDYVHGEYFGIQKSEIQRIQVSGKIAIKEIHPFNFQKFRNPEYRPISVVIERKNSDEQSEPHIVRDDRPREENLEEKFQSNLKINTTGLTIEESADFFLKKLASFIKHNERYPTLQLVNEINQKGYTKIAPSFNDDKRITTRNFHQASIPFWRLLFDSVSEIRDLTILELGPGNGWLFNSFPQNGSKIYTVDISPSMKANYSLKSIVSSSDNIPLPSKQFDLIVGSLIDPLISLETLSEVERLLKTNGLFAFTTPSWEWASNLSSRKKNQTSFIDDLNNKVEVFSFCDVEEILPSALSITSMELVQKQAYQLNETKLIDLSPAITQSASVAGKGVDELSIVTGVILKKY